MDARLFLLCHAAEKMCGAVLRAVELWHVVNIHVLGLVTRKANAHRVSRCVVDRARYVGIHVNGRAMRPSHAIRASRVVP